MRGLHLAQGHFDQASGTFDFMHGRQGHDLAGRFGVQQDGLLGDGEGADQVFGGLDEEVFEGLVGVVRWIGDDLEHVHL